MLTSYLAGVQRGLSQERLSGYRQPGDDDLTTMTTYFWNVALCQTLYPSLSAVEVSMRNGIHDALTVHFGTAAWYDTPNLLLGREVDQVIEAKRKIQRSRKTVVPPRVVAGLDFGFWISILDQGYGNSIWSANNPAVLVQRQVRSRVHRRFNAIRFLRNRVFHYEPVWRGVVLPNGRVSRLGDLHFDVIDAIGWIDPSLQATVAAFNAFPNTYQSGRLIVQWQLKQHLGLP